LDANVSLFLPSQEVIPTREIRRRRSVTLLGIEHDLLNPLVPEFYLRLNLKPKND